MHYYEVSLGTPRLWKSSRLTYSSEAEVDPNTVVQVPFGKGYRVGMVTRSVQKPSFDTKPIYAQSPETLPDSSQDFMKWFGDFYALSENERTSLLFPRYLRVPKKLPDLPEVTPKDLPTLSEQQQRAFDQLTSSGDPALLRGITGSGKTRIYMHLIADQLANGRSTLLLLPEILLTTQIIGELQQYFPCITFHSKLTDSQRSKLWFQVLSDNSPRVIIGARSALFLPFQNLSQIIIDEAHDPAYKQESDVRYNSLLTAGGLARVLGAKLVLGSATPPVTESFLLLESGGQLVELDQKAIQNTSSSNVDIIDRNDRTQFKKHPLLSDKLIDQIGRSLTRNKQSLLFLNRRGTARLLTCENDDWHAECPRCELPLTYHHDDHVLLCHSCGYKTSPPAACPECEGRLKPTSMGVKSIVSDIEKLFPKAKVGRYDSDTSTSETFHENYDAIKAGGIDIIIGTQQLTKGLDLPLLETVGIINADLPLNFPDFSSSERQFQLLAQVSGRVNRGHGSSHVIVQTTDPNNEVIHEAVTEDWPGFYKREISERTAHGFPPSSFAAKVIFRDKNEKKARQLTQNSLKLVTNSAVVGPLPSFHLKKGGHYYYQLLLTSKRRSDLLKDIEKMPKEALIDIDPSSLL